ncbi:polyphenol oxidase family protein [Allobranchiibius sp. CTAmp26]|uniref:polyphenol oxidase family protein n=1 Tax=Allobranchiibius sp. CTAmp26 TaxID=2815214 RepID=UPI001AA0CC5A|nr:polyphenol oxidase family protein [Allobranchiibius sp. CTAmp26]MBO1755261.1 laccase domain-containing protein [Allobranchiibius sp. CTAmp26]
MFWWRDTVAGSAGRTADVAFTDRTGGASSGLLGSLNLGASVGDDPDAVRSNRATVAQAMGLAPERLAFMHQVHGNHAVHTTSATAGARPRQCDGQVTDVPGLGLAVLVADCTPVLLVDVDAGVVAAVHAGRPGMTAGVVDATLDKMAGLGSAAPQAFVGPSVCGRCYEVPEQMRADAARKSPESRAVSWTGTPAIDVASGVVSQLRSREVPVTWVPGCTRESDRLFSYRRDHGEGRFAGIVVLRDGAGRVG